MTCFNSQGIGENLKRRNEAKIIQEMTRLITHETGASKEGINEGLNNAIIFCGSHAQAASTRQRIIYLHIQLDQLQILFVKDPTTTRMQTLAVSHACNTSMCINPTNSLWLEDANAHSYGILESDSDNQDRRNCHGGLTNRLVTLKYLELYASYGDDPVVVEILTFESQISVQRKAES